MKIKILILLLGIGISGFSHGIKIYLNVDKANSAGYLIYLGFVFAEDMHHMLIGKRRETFLGQTEGLQGISLGDIRYQEYQKHIRLCFKVVKNNIAYFLNTAPLSVPLGMLDGKTVNLYLQEEALLYGLEMPPIFPAVEERKPEVYRDV